MLGIYMPASIGLKRISGARKRSRPILTSLPSGITCFLSKFVWLLHMMGGLFGKFLIHTDISRYEAIFLLELSHDLEVSRTVEGVALVVEQLNKVVGNVPTRNVHPSYLMVQNVVLEDWYAVCHTITTVNQHRGHTPLCKQRHQCLDTQLKPIYTKCLEQYLRHLQAVYCWITHSLGHHQRPTFHALAADLLSLHLVRS